MKSFSNLTKVDLPSLINWCFKANSSLTDILMVAQLSKIRLGSGP